ncbi:MAG TPA: hypothetical protein VJL84_00805, partial [Kiloniellales bacterium]|nr:hypothetical protein [Kiloniellales bacterium]
MSRGALARDEATLAAYLDDELDDATVAEVEAWLAEDGRARHLLEVMEGADRRLRGALDPLLDEAPPAQLLRRIEAAAAGRRRAPGAASGLSWRSWMRGRMPWALAAALVLLAIGLPAAWFIGHERGGLAERQAQAAMTEREARAEVSLEA